MGWVCNGPGFDGGETEAEESKDAQTLLNKTTYQCAAQQRQAMEGGLPEGTFAKS